jgi:uncharacterized membrane protein
VKADINIMNNKNIDKIFRAIWFLSVLFFSLCFVSNKVSAQGAYFYVSPDKLNFNAGQNFTVDILINTGGNAINAVQATLYFPTDKIKVVDISKSGSIFSLWIQEPTWSDAQGTVIFGGGLPSPGFSGQAGKLFTITFQGISTDEAKIYFGGEAILANDPLATNIFSASYGGTYNIESAEAIQPPEVSKVPAAPKITSPTHPSSDKWYSGKNPKFEWSLPSDIDGISFAFNEEPIFDPGSSAEKIASSKSFEEVEDGAWYFHLKLKNEFGWSKTSHFRVQIDTQAPHPFETKIDNEGDPTNPSPLLFFKAEDDTSGINYYEVQVGEGDVFTLLEIQTNPYRMSRQDPGSYPVKVIAVDHAGNRTQSTAEVIIESIAVPQITVCPGEFISGEEVLHLEGTAIPDSAVLIFFEINDQLIKEGETKSDGEGYWSFAEEGLLKSGQYRILARTKDSRGAVSNPSEDCAIKVVLSGISIGPWTLSYSWVLIILIILFIILIIFLLYLFRRINKTKETIDRETKDLKKKFYKEYYELQKDIMEQLKRYRKAKAERGLTKEEEEMEKRLLDNLADVERVLREELKDIEEIK